MRREWTVRLVPAALCAVALLILFQFFGNAVRGYIDTASLFYWWGYQWINPGSETEHGWLILGLSAWLLWRNLHERREARGERREIGGEGLESRRNGTKEKGERTGPPSSVLCPPASGHPAPASRLLPHATSIVAMLAALALHALGFVAQQTRISILAFLLFTWGVLRLGGGRRWGGAAMFPLAFMVFAIPINVLDSLGFWLRIWVVDSSAAIARGAGIDVLQSGTQLVAPDGSYNYDVAAACSGVRSLTAMVALSLLAGYLNFRGWGRRALILLLCFPLVYIGNVARIVAIIFAAQIGGTPWGDVAHDLMGYGIFAIVLGGALAGVATLRRWWPETAERRTDDGGQRTDDGGRRREDGGQRTDDRRQRTEDDVSSEALAEGEGGSPETAGTAAYWVLSVILGLSLAEMLFLHHVANSPASGMAGVALSADGLDPVELPPFIGTDWMGRRTEVTAIEREILPADTGFSRKLYVNLTDPARQVLLSIVLSGRDRTSIHRPELCLIGQGWTITGTTRHVFGHPVSGARPFEATLLRVQREVQTPSGKIAVPQLVAYWFVGGSETLATHWQRVVRDSWNRVRHGRADRWAYVLMQTDAPDGEAAAVARMQAVLDGALPVFAPQKPEF